jgi:dienelactone hydrolase
MLTAVLLDITGPVDATKGLISIFDIFGFVPQTLQGADILASGNETQTHKVFMPDWFKGNAVPAEWYPPDTEEKQKKLGEWFGNNDPGKVAAALPAYVKAAQAANPSIKSWAILGYCWGGKVVELVTSSAANPFAAAAVAHPAMIDPKGAEKITVPFALLASGEDPAEDVKAFESGLNVPHHVETFKDQVHGWMAARADLSDARQKAEYARGYQTVLDFFGKHWK